MRILIWGAIIIFAALILLIIYCRTENRKFRVTRYSYKTDRVKEKLTLCVLADLHCYVYGENNQRLFDAIREINPDLVISAGDMTDGSRYAKGNCETMEFLSRLAKAFPFVYGSGNHEYKLMYGRNHKYERVRNDFRKGLENAEKSGRPLEILDNRDLDLPDKNIKIYGLNLGREYFFRTGPIPLPKEKMDSLVGEADPERLNILIGHNPEYFDAYAEWGADLVLSGHVHGGMVRTPWNRGIISPRMQLFPKYDRGVFKKGKTTMVLSGGIGNHTIHVRINNRAELLVVEVIPDGHIGAS